MKTILAPGHGYEAIVRRLRKDANPRRTLDAVETSAWGTGGLAARIAGDVKDGFENYGQPADRPMTGEASGESGAELGLSAGVTSSGRSLDDSPSPAYVDRILVCERDRFRLTLYDLPIRTAVKYDILERFDIAVGAKGYNTPRGMYRINSKVKYPAWTMPDSEWVPEELRGTVIPGAAEANPLKERWMGVTEPEEGVGIHGTGELGSIGLAVSHGCIRMRPTDVVELYEEVPLGTPIYIV